ncbi:PREDICTED: signal-transducing adaptor protein 1-like isoform X1 [Branchiostoma belcheri]|uniref:Signal-transducing adaptor protein 1-like isoform X1 n=1 Tax=Branchiostoma belcheri TaxID=7741 RepID=A0A6P4ZBD2_BRABE|nr:PREDICTED: signal-transducing adaptor protein 1-like isoform X1 [Branchiostoma belcheri]
MTMTTWRPDDRRASAASPWRVATNVNPDLPKYHEGFLEKKFKSGYQRVWAELKADVMFFYHPERQDEHVLGYLKLDRTTTVEYPKTKGRDRGHQHKFIVKCNKDLHKFQVIGAQLRDVWKAYILTIATHVVPEDLNLLPGQLIDVRRTLEQETYRLASPPPPVPPHNVNGNVTRSASSSSGYSSGQSGTNMSGSGDSAGSEASSLPPPPAAVEMHAYRFYPDYLKERGRVRPPWFFHLLPRDQVEQVLADNIVNGNMLLRSSDSAPGGLVLSARLPVNGEPQVRHYIVNMTNGHFVLDIDKKHPPILNIYELINYFIDQSGGNVVPLETSDLSQLALPAGLYEGDRVVKLDQCPHWGEWSAKPVPKSVVNMLKYSVPPDELHKVQEMSIWNPPSMQLPEVDYDDEPTPIFLEHDDDDVHDYVNCEEEKNEEWVEDTEMKIPRPQVS